MEKAAEPAPQASEVKFKLTDVEIDARELKVDAAALEAILAPCVGRETTLTELNAALAQVTAYCRRHGYPASAAYLPAQDSKDGKITVKVIPGRYGEIKLDNHSRLKDKVALRLLHGLQPGSIIRSSKLETVLYSISDVSGTRAVGVLAPGKAFGTSDVTVRIEDGKPTNTMLYAENYGAKSSGRYRYGLQHTVYDVSGKGGRLSLGTLISNSHMHNYYANYELPVGRGGSTLGLGVSQMDYKLGGAMRDWGANGKADTVSLFGSYPFYHLHDGALKLTYGIDYRRLKDDLDKFQGVADSKKHAASAHVGIEGSAQMPKTALSYDATLTAGHLTLDGTHGRYVYEALRRRYGRAQSRPPHGCAHQGVRAAGEPQPRWLGADVPRRCQRRACLSAGRGLGRCRPARHGGGALLYRCAGARPEHVFRCGPRASLA